MELLVADIRHQLGGEWTLLGPQVGTTSSFSLDWGGDDKLRLPRMEDSLFGVSILFPEEEHDDGYEAAAASVDEQVADSSLDCEQQATDGASSPDKAAPLDSSFENRLPDDESDTDQVVDAQASQGTNEEAVAAHGISSDTSRRDACVSAVEIRGTALQAETDESDERQAENMDGPLQRSKDGNPNVQEILATHSRAEILLELEWARQALCDRRKYLRSKSRVERA